jgi:hypothetical protein
LQKAERKDAPMTKYEELSRIAVEHSRQVYQQKEACERFAFELIKGLMEYLGSPLGTVRFYTVDEKLEPNSELENTALTVPKLRQYKDGFCYFGVDIHFAHPEQPRHFAQVGSLFGIKKSDESFIVRSEKDIGINPNERKTYLAFYDYLHNELKEYYSTPIDQPPRRIGFAPS